MAALSAVFTTLSLSTAVWLPNKEKEETSQPHVSMSWCLAICIYAVIESKLLLLGRLEQSC